jgi:hypothetical protein
MAMALKYYGIEIEWVYNKRCIQGVRKIVTQSEGEVWQSGLCANCRFVCQFLFKTFCLQRLCVNIKVFCLLISNSGYICCVLVQL